MNILHSSPAKLENPRFGFQILLLLFAIVQGLILCFPTAFSNAGQASPSVSLRPREIPLGGVAILEVALPPGSSLKGIFFLGKEVPFYREKGSKKLQAILGASLKTKPGVHVLSLRWKGKGGISVSTFPVKVKHRNFPEERLKVDKKMVDFPPEILRRVRQDQAVLRKACNCITWRRYWTPPFVWPVESKLLSPFGLRRIFNGQPRSPHSGVDLRAPTGTPIKAANAGRVSLVRNCYLSGWTVVVDHGYGLCSLYAHLSKVKVRQGDAVRRGQIIGLSGKTGRATGPHLHWGISLLGTRLDPQQFMQLLGAHGETKTGG